jgi:[protein-PII] uridylyltransferase
MIFRKKPANLKIQLNLLEEPPEALAPYRIPFKIGEIPSESARAYLKQCREQLKTLHRSGFPSDQILRLNTLYVDDLVLTLFERADWLFQESHPNASRKCALIALGGYGRHEMSPHSDVDLLFLYPDRPEEYVNQLTDAILYVLWDCALDVGNASRSVKDCRKILREDAVTFTSMLDARYLAGDKQVATDFFKIIEEEIANRNQQQFFIEEKFKETEERRKRFGGSVYILEPNVKESEGGLRDLQTLIWYARVLKGVRKVEDLVTEKILNPDALRDFLAARSFLWQVRNALHFRTDQKNDQITFQYQEEIAKELGFKEEGGILAVENFMQAYYGHAANIKRITSMGIASLVESPERKLKLIKKKEANHLGEDFAIVQEKILAKRPDVFEKDPLNLMRVFLIAQREKADLDEATRALIIQGLSAADENFAERADVNRLLRELFGELSGLGRVLQLMHECRVLDKVIPEFGEVLYRPQHDVYHIYTVDTHSIFAVGELSKLKEGVYDQEFPILKEILSQTPRHDLLAFGVFFHDVGKGRGKNHSIVGAEMAARAAERMGYPEKDREAIEFLVKSHLLMPHLSQRRDLDDANLIIQFAKSMQLVDNLNMLFILTWADIRAVGPEVWTPWKGSLLTELYTRTKLVLESGSFTKEGVDKMVAAMKERVIASVADRVNSKDRADYLSNMPVKYFLGHSPEEISRHLELIALSGFEQLLIQISVLEKENLNELILYTLGTPGLLPKTTGVLAANDLNIIEAKQYLSKTGHALLILRFTDSQGQVLREERRFELFKKDLQDIFEGRLRVAALIDERKKPLWMQKKLARTFPTRVEIDNDVSAYYTVIDIYTHDRVGLLYQIFTALSGLGLYVDVSKISTKVDQVADVFYVKIFSDKLWSRKAKTHHSELMRVIEGKAMLILVTVILLIGILGWVSYLRIREDRYLHTDP